MIWMPMPYRVTTESSETNMLKETIFERYQNSTFDMGIFETKASRQQLQQTPGLVKCTSLTCL